MPKPLHIAIITGEASGDLLGAGLIQALRKHHPNIEFSGIGGPHMIQAGFHSLFNQDELAVMGIIEPLRRLPRLLHIRSALYRHYSQNKPDLFMGIDSPDFNLGLELKLRQEGIPTVHYVSPSVWAWRQNRIHKIAKAVDLMLTLLPFEADFYKKHQVPVKYVGHHLADKIPLQPDTMAARQGLGLEPSKKYIALLPGSRKQELHYLAKSFLEAALLCQQANPDICFITASVNAARDAEWQALHQAIAPHLPLRFYVGKSREVMAAADAVLVTSGTATLEVMLHKKPMVIAYRTSGFNFFLAKLLIKVPFIGLPNLLAQEAIVPELIQDAAKPEMMANYLLDYINNPQASSQLQAKFTAMHKMLSQNADEQAARAVLKVLGISFD